MIKGKKLILIVDDAITNLKNAEEVLKKKYDLALAKSGQQALAFLENTTPDLILLDILMPEMDGFEVMEVIKENPVTEKIPVIFLTVDNNKESELKGFALGAQDFITKPFVSEIMVSRIERILELDELRKNLENKVKKQTEQLEKVALQVVTTVANVVDNKCEYTIGHSVRVARYSEEIARRLGWEKERISKLHYMALLHDIGKIAVPDYILNKSGELNEEEEEIIKRHPVIGCELLRDLTVFNNIADGARYHHERYDGNGYNEGLKGDKIPIEARIICIADAYDAMNSDRAYRQRYSDKEIREKFLEERTKQFDPKLVDIVLKMMVEGFELNKEDTMSRYDDLDGMLGISGVILQKILTEYAEEIRNEASKDPLTNLWNRQYTEEIVNKYLSDKDNNGVMFMIDMDDFKTINDTYGHIVGDEILIKMADILRECTRQDDIICRIGGDEFIIFLKDIVSRRAITEKAKLIFDKLSAGIRNLRSDTGATISMGIAVSPKDGRDFNTLYNNADKSLYYVKQKGKGEYHFYSDEEEDVLVDIRSTQGDLNYLKNLIDNTENSMGAYMVEYDGFKKIYRFVERYISRINQDAQVVLFTLMDENGNIPEGNELENAYTVLRESIQFQLRRGDVFTSFSSSQYIVILMNANEKVGTNVSERVLKKYLQDLRHGNVKLIYDLQGINAND